MNNVFNIKFSVLAGSAILALSFFGFFVRAEHTNGVGLKTLGTRPPDIETAVGQPYETRPSVNPVQKPAFDGQTRAPSVKSKTEFKEEIITHGLNHPWGFVFLPNDKILVTEKTGSIRIIDAKSGKIEQTIDEVPLVKYGGDAGLLDVVLDPQYKKSGLIFFAYVEPRGEENGVVIAKAKLVFDKRVRLDNVTTVLRVLPMLPQTAHYGCRLLFDKDENLFVSLGERFYSPTRDEAQSLYSMMGKILKITKDGKPVASNPYAKAPKEENSPRPEIYSYGHRNPQGLALNPLTGDLWESEHGPQGGDEINLIKAGKNYGWPVIAYGANYDNTKINNSKTAQEGMEQPVYYWDPTVAPSGMTFYNGKMIPEWKNNLFVATLAGEHVVRLVIKDTKIIGEERLLLDQHQRMRDIKQSPDGALWVITDEADGRLIRISPK